MYTPSSTILGSTIIILTSSGRALNRILSISEFIHTLLPEPVAPAMRPCGKSAMSATTQLPLISLPRANAVFELKFLNLSLIITSRIGTGVAILFGISIPITDLPDTGSILTPDAARLSAISSERLVIFDTFIPGPGCNSNRVTVGPCVIFTIFASTLKLFRVCKSRFAFSSSSERISELLFFDGFGMASKSAVGR